MSKSQPVFENGQLVHLGFIARPSETVPDQGFELFGWMSEMISRHYLALTMSDEGQEIERLLPSTHLDPGSLGVLVPDDYRGKSLRLWRFFTDPKSNTSFAFFARDACCRAAKRLVSILPDDQSAFGCAFEPHFWHISTALGPPDRLGSMLPRVP